MQLTAKGMAWGKDPAFDASVVVACYKVAVLGSTIRLVNKLLCHHVMDGLDSVDGDAEMSRRVVDRMLGLFNA